MQRLFDHIERTLHGPADYLISEFDYLNNSDRIEANKVRDFLESCFASFPVEHQKELRVRIRSPKEHRSSIFELLLYRVFTLSACQVELHPPSPCATTRIDFRVTPPRGSPSCVEAIAPAGLKPGVAGSPRLREEVLNAIEELSCHEYYFNLQAEGVPAQSVPKWKIKSIINQWINSQNYGDVLSRYRDLPPRHTIGEFCFEGLRVNILLVPRASMSIKSDRRILARSMDGPSVSIIRLLADKVKDKSLRYGPLSIPYVIAVNVPVQAMGVDAIFRALFGHTDFQSAKFGSFFKLKPQISAVLVATDLSPWSVTTTGIYLIRNPWAEFRLDCDFLDRFDIHLGDSFYQDGETLRGLFQLPANWPGD